jgi:hypothetical protein
MTMKSMTRTIAACGVIFAAGCQVPAPIVDTTPPEITVLVSGAHGRNIFRSADGVLAAPDNCIKVSDMPTQLILIVGDAGGVDSASINAFAGTIVPASVDVAPRAPEGSFAIRSGSGGDTLAITLTPPSPTTVRTAATAVFEVNGTLPMAITASARDRAGHAVELPQFDLRALDDTGVRCRGDR